MCKSIITTMVRKLVGVEAPVLALICFGRRSFGLGIGLVLDHDHLLLSGGSLGR